MLRSSARCFARRFARRSSQGFALAQSLPGPLFNFSSFVGGAYLGVGGALIAYLGLFGPGVILIFAMMPFWSKMRHVNWFKAVLVGLGEK